MWPVVRHSRVIVTKINLFVYIGNCKVGSTASTPPPKIIFPINTEVFSLIFIVAGQGRSFTVPIGKSKPPCYDLTEKIVFARDRNSSKSCYTSNYLVVADICVAGLCAQGVFDGLDARANLNFPREKFI